MAPRSKAAKSLPQAGDLPEGFDRLGGSNAPTWQPGLGDSIQGIITEPVKEVEFTQKRTVNGKKVDETVQRRVLTVTTEDNQRHAVWESAALGELFEKALELENLEVFIRFDGLGKKKAGQNPPKLFTVATRGGTPF